MLICVHYQKKEFKKLQVLEELNMNKDIDVSEQLKNLINDFEFNINTLSEYLGLNNEQILMLANGDTSFLPNDNKYRFNLFNKIEFLYYSAIDENDFKLDAFLKVLLSYHNISKKLFQKYQV